jgi:hypothetical protein
VTTKLKRIPRSIMKAKSVTRLVGQVAAGDGILVTKAAGVFTVAVDVNGGVVQPYDADLAALAANSTNGFWAHTSAGAGAARTLTEPAAGFTITNPAGVAGNPTFVLANDLLALEGLSSTGLAVRTASDTWAQRSLAAPAAGFTITNNDGVSGNPTFVLANDLAALEAMSGTGLVVRTAAETYAQRTLTGTAAEITVTNGDGISGAPTFSLPSALTFTGKTVTGGTFANPTLSGTVAGAPTVSGAWTFTAVQTISRNATAVPTPPSGTLLNLVQVDGAGANINLEGFAAAGAVIARRANTTNAAKSAILSGDGLGAFAVAGYDGSAYTDAKASISFFAGGNWSGSSNPVYFDFYTTPAGSTTPVARGRVEIDGGLTWPSSVTGGSKGAGTINATELYRAGTVLATVATSASASDLSTGTLPAGRLPALTGDITSSAGSAATTLAAGNAGNLNSGTLLAARMPALSGDITTSAGAIATTLATVNSNVGTFGSATQASQVTVNAKGLVTAAANVTVTPAVGSITGFGTSVATALAVNVGTAGAFVVNGGALGSPSSAGTLPAFTLGGTISGGGNQLNNIIIGTTTPLAGTFTSVTFSPTTGGIVGTTTNDNTAAGKVGEFVQSDIPSASEITLTNNTAANITSISLTAGDWDVWGNFLFDIGATTVPSYFIGCTNDVSATLATVNGGGYAVTAITTTANYPMIAVHRRYSLSTTTTIYLVVQCGFTISTLKAYGAIQARRRR